MFSRDGRVRQLVRRTGIALARSPLRNEHGGVALILVVAFMALAIPVVTAALDLASTVSVDSRVKTELMKGQYSAVGAAEHGQHRLIHEPGYAASLQPGVPDTYTITLNGQQVPVAIEKLGNEEGAPGRPNTQLQASKVVVPTTAEPGTSTIFTYTLTVTNEGSDPTDIDAISDVLAPGFSYVPSSTTGVITFDPDVSTRSTLETEPRELLTWDLRSLDITLDPSEAVFLSFEAEANVTEGNYCNEAWTNPGWKSSSSGPTAKVVVGSPSSNLCTGEAAQVSKTVEPQVVSTHTPETFTYTIDVTNAGSTTLQLSLLIDVLPAGFAYQDTLQDDFSFSPFFNPLVWYWGGQQYVMWLAIFSPKSIAPGATKTLEFTANAELGEAGFYHNEVWVVFDNLSIAAYTGPTATVEGIDAFGVTGGSKSTVSAKVWLNAEKSLSVKGWEFRP